MLRQIRPFVTNELPPAIADAPTADQRAQMARIAAATPRDAIAEIVDRARRTRIVILNEAHYSPRDRAFALEVAQALRPLGYTILGAEAFDNSAPTNGALSPIEMLRRDGFVRQGTGFYTLDPVYARYVSAAMWLGYRPEAYEWTSAQWTANGGIADREQAQARNLAALVDKNPGARFLVHVGHGHVWEDGGTAGGTSMMAGRLAGMTGINPLTIDQVQVTDLRSDRAAVHAAAAQRVGTRAGVLVDGKGPLAFNVPAGRHVDLQVFHPVRTYRFGRPAWLAMLQGRPLTVPRTLAPTACPRLIQAFARGALNDAVPLDQAMAEPGKPLPTLLVPPEPIRFAIQDADCSKRSRLD